MQGRKLIPQTLQKWIFPFLLLIISLNGISIMCWSLNNHKRTKQGTMNNERNKIFQTNWESRCFIWFCVCVIGDNEHIPTGIPLTEFMFTVLICRKHAKIPLNSSFAKNNCRSKWTKKAIPKPFITSSKFLFIFLF